MSDLLPSTIVTSSTYTFAVTDNGTVVEGNSATAQTFTIATNATAAFEVGAILEVYQAGAGQITVAAAAGVNLRTPNGSRTAERYATVSLRQRAVDEWVLSGDTDGVGTGPVGATGPPGADGAAGPPGPAGGGAISDLWVWLAPSTSATVGATRVGVNNDAPTAATEAWIHKESKNANIDYSTTIVVLTSGDHLYLQSKSNAASFHRYTVTDTPTLMGGTTWKIPVVTDTGSPSGTEPANGADVLVAFQFQPLQGPTGPAGPTGATGATGVGVPVGGTAGQSLTKIDATNYNTAWTTVTGGGGGTTVTDRGLWAASTAYNAGDVVTYGGHHFQRLTSGFTSGSTFDPSNWLALDPLTVDNPATWTAATAADYEFDATTSSLPSGWAWVNQGSATYTEAQGAGVLACPAVAASTDTHRMFVRNVPAASTWLATMKFSVLGSRAAVPSYAAGIYLRESSTGKIMSVHTSSSSAQEVIQTSHWNDTAGAGGVHYSTAVTFTQMPIWYFRVRKNSSTSYDFEVSPDGLAWLSVDAARNMSAFFTPDQIGFGMELANTQPASQGACYWMRCR